MFSPLCLRKNARTTNKICHLIKSYRIPFACNLISSIPKGVTPLMAAEFSPFAVHFLDFSADLPQLGCISSNFENSGPLTTNHVEALHHCHRNFRSIVLNLPKCSRFCECRSTFRKFGWLHSSMIPWVFRSSKTNVLEEEMLS